MKRAFAAIAIGVALLAPRPARATLDPSRAGSDVETAMRTKDYAFCKHPHEPLSDDARRLCPHAEAIPDCEGFAEACAKLAKAPTTGGPSGTVSPSTGGGASRGGSSPSLPPPPGLGGLGLIAQVLVWLLVAALVIAVLVPIVRALARLKRDKKLSDPQEKKPEKKADAPAVEIPSHGDEDSLLRIADEHARRGDLAVALQLYLAASLRALDKRGAVRLAKDRTNGEYVRGCGDAGAKPALREIVREVDRVQFGREDATHEGVSRAAQRASAIVRSIPMMLVALAVALQLGCGGGGGPAKAARAGDDPAGDELLHDVLAAQGVKLGSLPVALASLPLPKAGERLPAVVVDAERVEIDDDTHAHLVEWVEAGGVLVLAGAPERWPHEFGAAPAQSTGMHRVTARRTLARAGSGGGDDDDDEAASSPTSAEDWTFSSTLEHGQLVSGAALGWKGVTVRVAWFDDGMTYAAIVPRGKGWVLGIASDELLMNAGIAHPGNGAVIVAILSAADRTEFQMADPDDGVSPPSTPIAALTRAGLGLGLWHALPAALLLFFAVGVRVARPKPTPPPLRRAFAEHVEAVGAMYGRTRNAGHALGAYARFADERIRQRMPRGTGDVAWFLASRARVPLAECQRVWTRAMAAKVGAPPLGDELAVLKDLSALYGAAMAQDK